MKKTVLVALPVLLIGGTEIQTLSLVRVLVSAEFSVKVCCYYEFDEIVVKDFRTAGAEVILMRLSRPGAATLWKLFTRLLAIFRLIRPDIIHVQYLAPGLIPILAARLSGVSTVFATVHIAGRYAYGIKAKAMLRTAARMCTAFFCVSRGVEEFWFGDSVLLDEESVKSERSHFTIYNGIDVRQIETCTDSGANQLRESLGISSQPLLGIVGRLAEQKGHSVLLEALPEIIHNFPDLKLIVVGDGPEAESLKRKAKILGVYDQILWMGAHPQKEVFRLYGAMDIFIMPSFYEGLGLSAVEAMAAGLPVICSGIEGLREAVEDDLTGHHFPAGDSQALSLQIIDLLSDPLRAKEMGRRGRQRARDLFSMNAFHRTMLLAYRELGV